jgi:DNA mismatch endonuclease (patch repair protein)
VPDGPPLLSFFSGEVEPARSTQMGRIRGKDTGPERDLRTAVWRLGGRFRTHVRGLPGTPDLANRRAKVAVFVDGCFWHGCPRHFRVPKTRAAFWSEKIHRNQENRRRHVSEYPSDWRVFQFYECGLKGKLEDHAKAVAAALKA